MRELFGDLDARCGQPGNPSAGSTADARSAAEAGDLVRAFNAAGILRVSGLLGGVAADQADQPAFAVAGAAGVERVLAVLGVPAGPGQGLADVGTCDFPFLATQPGPEEPADGSQK
jgi:hypothetical protein